MKERRQGPDWLTKLLQLLVLLSWLCFIAVLTLYHYARPNIAYGFLRYKHIAIHTNWDPYFTRWFLYWLWFNSLLTLGGILLKKKRSRRHDDALHINLFLLMLILIASLLLYYAT